MNGNIMHKTLLFFFLLLSVKIKAQPPLANDTLIPVHDPVIIREDSTYYIFATGNGISVFSSNDMKYWKREKPVFDTPPQWAKDAIPGFRSSIWAPDISYHNGLYYLYYSVSAFGKNTSCIGVATNKTLNRASKDFKWADHGKVVQSVPARDMWNAIDPNLIIDENKTPWLVFGSFWNGMKLVKLKDDLVTIAQPEVWFTVASRKRDPVLPDSVAGDAAIEAPFIYKHDKFYYLFVSFDYCCRGEKSTYKMMVGRSEKVSGPYMDKNGVSMNAGGGSLLLEGNKSWYGVGHNAVALFNGNDYLVYHAYDANDRGRSKLQIEKIIWVNGWPSVER
jgi:arabinan endo-1,5-alpha-L-arabinosidase